METYNLVDGDLPGSVKTLRKIPNSKQKINKESVIYFNNLQDALHILFRSTREAENIEVVLKWWDGKQERMPN